MVRCALYLEPLLLSPFLLSWRCFQGDLYAGLCCVSACRVQCDMLPFPQGVQPCAVQCDGLTPDFAREQGFVGELELETLCETAHVPVQDCTQTSGPGAVVLFAAGMPPAVGGYSARPRDSRVVYHCLQLTSALGS